MAVEHIKRKGDRKVYQPQLRSDVIHQLYELKQKDGTHMTVHLDKAVREYIKNYKTGKVEWQEDQALQEHLELLEFLDTLDLEHYAEKQVDLGDWKDLINYEGNNRP